MFQAAESVDYLTISVILINLLIDYCYLFCLIFCIFSFKSIQNFFIIISQSEQPTTLEIISMSSLSDILRILIYIDDVVTHCILADIDTQKQSHYFLFMQS